MAKILATWICIDDSQTASWFPSSKGNSSDQNIQNIYWKCPGNMYVFSTHVQPPKLSWLFFPNIQHLPVVEGLDFKNPFSKARYSILHNPI